MNVTRIFFAGVFLGLGLGISGMTALFFPFPRRAPKRPPLDDQHFI